MEVNAVCSLTRLRYFASFQLKKKIYKKFKCNKRQSDFTLHLQKWSFIQVLVCERICLSKENEKNKINVKNVITQEHVHIEKVVDL
jgi:hypothetical protein